MKSFSHWSAYLPSLVAGAILFTPMFQAKATPYATCLTNSGSSITFRLNEAADNVQIVSSGGTVTNDLGALGAGLQNAALSIVGTYQIYVTKVGSGVISQIGSSVAFGTPRGVAVNNNPSSPNFGKIYVANASATPGDGVYVHYSDLMDAFGAPRTAGYAGFATSTTASPMRLTVGPDDQVYICDWSDATGNLIATDPDVTTYQYVLRALEQNPDTLTTGAIPVGTNNNHGSVYGVAVKGSIGTGDLVVYAFDEDYQEDPTSAFAYQMNSVWEYQIGSGPLPWSNAPTLLGVPSINFVSQNGDVALGPNGYVYMNQRRANASSGVDTPSLMILDPANVIPYVDYGTYWPAHPGWGGYIWSSQEESINLGSGGTDYYGEINGVAVSPDGKYVVGIHWGSYGGYGANELVFAPLNSGIPDLSQRFSYAVGGAAAGRGVAFDRANNVYMISSGLGQLRAYSLGNSAVAISGSDGTFSLVLPSTQVGVAATSTPAYEAGPTSGQFTVTRSGATTDPLTVNITVAGTAVRGTDYTLKTNGVAFTVNSVTIPSGSSTLQIEVAPVDDTTAELTETVIVNVAASGNYNIDQANKTATVEIMDNETPMADVVVVLNSMYEANANDYARFRIVRRGDINAASFSVNITYSGTAAGSRYTGPASVAVDPGVINQNFDIQPVDDGLLQGNQTIVANVASGTGYTVGTNSPSATATIVDDEVPAESVLFSDNFNVDSSASWTARFAARNDIDGDYTVNWAYDYSGEGIPPSPNGGGDTLGVKMTVNKLEFSPGGGCGLNLYPNGQSFSGNYALRFDMYLTQQTSSTTEHAIFGVNHSGTKTNWFRNSSTGNVPNDGVGTNGWSYDGTWCQVVADASGLGDYVLNAPPTITSGGITGPTAYASRLASSLTGIFKNPPWTPGGGGGGSPANLQFSATPSWAEVELSQVNNVVTLKINNTVIFSAANPTSTSGNIMLGYDDAYDSNAGIEGAVIYDNVRVISLGGLKITSIQILGGTTVQIDFTWGLNDPASAFNLLSATTVGGTYSTVAGQTITVLSPGASYRATAPLSGGTRFYKVVHQ